MLSYLHSRHSDRSHRQQEEESAGSFESQPKGEGSLLFHFVHDHFSDITPCHLAYKRFADACFRTTKSRYHDLFPFSHIVASVILIPYAVFLFFIEGDRKFVDTPISAHQCKVILIAIHPQAACYAKGPHLRIGKEDAATVGAVVNIRLRHQHIGLLPRIDKYRSDPSISNDKQIAE